MDEQSDRENAEWAAGGLINKRHNVRLDRISYVSISDLKNYSRKLRKRSDEAFEKIKASISAFGIVLPALIDQHNTIISGEAIVAAAKALGHTEFPTIRVDHLDEAERRMLRIALNKLAEGSEWNKVELTAEFAEVLTLETDLSPELTGFGTIEIDGLLHPHISIENEEIDPDDEAVPIGEVGCAVACPGDLWNLGRHKVFCGSSLEMSDLALLMGNEKAHMVLNDGPYNVKISGHVSGLGKTKHREFLQASGDLSEAGFIDFQVTSTSAVSAFCVDGALLYLFIDWRHQWEMLSGIRAADLTMINLAVWVKRSGSMGSFYRSRHELVFIAKKGKAPHRNNVQLGRFGRSRDNCWFYPGMNTFSAERDELLAMHPTPKNVTMLADAIRDATHIGEIVLDGFLGSGSTLIAAERTGRICRGVELDPLYVDAIIQRWEKATGKRATLSSTGETLAEVAERRARERDANPVEIVARPRTRAVV